ncbi:MAG TPA: hypothetical protein DEE98_03270 [Elusimicrobia bacterium]|nr:MAG: hypothetical protein A2278_08085 [Elusimicrobia bacterium RIFOXYA12_FULL_49_49]OGS09942.1 MAG: hypothetical protein A2204_02590 [Elusimicrobia bacterium RIFOXYA1_FULL_47_7]OGS11276.1 MAG: hypothetical protein A2386_02095 [Elusimicrobia bacterium RIFOXYB1_FULL_48_9]OGS15977.1 MAG: hypothetical protein A2251_02180 [Elusimicrobia bacterium RIFOXYA2_FULL_47_53]OGS26343.1 MAG: hypothetical protein A2339_03085 [Elusimicrobia bacterium RIFOXYB12_FULL_50_12]OGS29145.1 MAG: hypothetical protein
MKTFIEIIIVYWTWFAFVISIIWGIYGAVLFTPKSDSKFKTILLRFYQFNFNFMGSLAGWFCFHILTIRLKAPYLNIGSTDFILIILTVLGLTGHLPESIYGLVISIKKLGEAVANRIIKSDEK